ncbi:MAG TPA: hypothetical protein VH333_19120 [Pseudonocardiaceae bacterium]|jgi:hypothetical protein|nr:hypothetical protein [Pseudonocardiaceae bacterium]
MSDLRLADARARIEANRDLRLPLPARDLLGRIALRFLWRRGLKWQVEANLATRDAVDGVLELGAALRADLHDVRRQEQNMLAGLNQRLYSAVGALRTELSDLRLRLADKAEQADEVQTRLDGIEAELGALVAGARATRLRHAQLDLYLDQQRPAAPPDPVPPVRRSALLELALVELLDGPADQVRTARSGYLPVLADARGPVFDPAPARGDWLDLLRGADIPARAASANPLVVRHCAGLGHDVTSADPLSALSELDGRSLGAVTAFRYVERLTPDQLARFVDLAAARLLPGGVLLVETPNPAGAAAGDFHLDPFARQPVHPMFLRFLVEAAGFGEVEIRYPDSGPFGGWPTDLSAPPTRRADRYCLLARI